MRLIRQFNTSWWQKSRLLSLFGIFGAIGLMLLVAIAVSNRTPAEGVGRLGALMLSFVPLLVVFAIAVFARVSEYINLRSGGQTVQHQNVSRRGEE